MSETAADRVLRARRAVGFLDAGGRATLLRVSGGDRVPFLHRVLTCDVKGAAVGSVLPGLLLTAKGKVLAEFVLAIGPDRVEIVAPAAARAALRDGIAKFVIGDDVRIEDRSEASTLLSFVGPRAEAAAARFSGIRRARAGLPAVDIVVEAADLDAVRRAALAAAESVGGGPLDAEEYEILRVEAGEPALGAEATEDTLPQECGLTDRVSFTKGCFVGQEPVARLQNRGHTNRGLAGLLLDPGAPLPARGDAVLAGGKEAGAVTSAVLSPSLGRPIALALLRHESAAPGTALEVRSAGGTLRAEAAALPFVR